MSKIRLSQQVKLSPQLALTKTITNSLKILQLSHTELLELVASEIDNNPLLQEIDNNEDNIPDNPVTLSGYRNNGREFDIENISKKKSLKEHVLEQIYINIEDVDERNIAFYFLDYLDNNGYLKNEVFEVLSFNQCEEKKYLKVLEKLHSFDPPGIFARNPQECLKNQLIDKGIYSKNFEIILDNLPLVAKNDLVTLSKYLGTNIEHVRKLISEIKKLNPKPGLNFSSDNNISIEPDVFIKKNSKGEWLVELNNNNLPKLLINRQYYSLLKSSCKKDEAEAIMISEYYNNANNLIRALDQRAKTILKIMMQIIEQQWKFFEYGMSFLVPMKLKDIAEKLDLHESTVSRVCNNKYVMTPFGTLPFKFFFSKSIENSEGKSFSSKMIASLIKSLIMNESEDNILSDDDIVRLLKQHNIDIARRTVAKYRISMNIASSYERKALKLQKEYS